MGRNDEKSFPLLFLHVLYETKSFVLDICDTMYTVFISSTKVCSTVLVMSEKVFHFSCLWIYRLRISAGPKKHLSCLFNLMMTELQIFCIRQLSFSFLPLRKINIKHIYLHILKNAAPYNNNC